MRDYYVWFGVLFGGTFLAALMILATLSLAYPADGFVSLLEQKVGMFPGQTRVVPECGCTIRYMGTSVHGRHYDVRIDRLD